LSIHLNVFAIIDISETTHFWQGRGLTYALPFPRYKILPKDILPDPINLKTYYRKRKICISLQRECGREEPNHHGHLKPKFTISKNFVDGHEIRNNVLERYYPSSKNTILYCCDGQTRQFFNGGWELVAMLSDTGI